MAAVQFFPIKKAKSFQLYLVMIKKRYIQTMSKKYFNREGDLQHIIHIFIVIIAEFPTKQEVPEAAVG